MYKRIINQETTGRLAAPSQHARADWYPGIKTQDSQYEPAILKGGRELMLLAS